MFFVLLTCFALRTFWKDESWSAFNFVAGPMGRGAMGWPPFGAQRRWRFIGFMFLIFGDFGEYLT